MVEGLDRLGVLGLVDPVVGFARVVGEVVEFIGEGGDLGGGTPN